MKKGIETNKKAKQNQILVANVVASNIRKTFCFGLLIVLCTEVQQ